MSSLVENATIKIRRDSAANWTSNNPTPASGEWCYETDTRHIKIGDGSTAWNSLTYHIGGSDIKNITTASDETETLPDPADIGGSYIIGRFGAGTGKATFNAPVGVNIRWPDGFTSSRIVFEGGGNATVVERAGELYVQEYEDCGTVADSGNDTNRTFKKFASGTMFQSGDHSQSLTISTAYLGGFRSAGLNATFGKPFSGTNYVINIENAAQLTVVSWLPAGSIKTTTQFNAVATAFSSQSSAPLSFGYTITGSWDRDAA